MAKVFDRRSAEQFDERMALRRRVIDALGIDLPQRPDGPAQELIRQTLINCVTCERAPDCRAWLGTTVVPGAEPPEFCMNRAQFEELRDRS